MLCYGHHKLHSARAHLRILFETINVQNTAVQLLSDGLVRPVCQKVIRICLKTLNMFVAYPLGAYQINKSLSRILAIKQIL